MIKNDPWYYIEDDTFDVTSDPIFGKIYTVIDYDPIPLGGEWFIILEGFDQDHSWDQSLFAPVVTDTVLAEELSEIFSEGIAVVK